MTLLIDRLSLDEFRGYTHLELSGLSHLNVIAGPNAVGKTNVVEGIQLLCEGQSFRNPPWSETVSWGSDEALLEARFMDGKRCVDHRLSIRGSERVYTVNGKRKPASAVCETCPCVLFTPDDLQLVKDSSARRRDAVDDMGVQLSKSFSKLRSDYRKIVKQRNLLLREDEISPALLSAYDESLVVTGAGMCVSRWRLFTRLSAYLEDVYARLVPGERLEAVYIPSWGRFDEEGNQLPEPSRLDFTVGEVPNVEETEEELSMFLSRVSSIEKQRKISLVGPQKDEMAFFLNGKNARLFASQGQQRTITLCFKIAQVELIEEMKGQPPVLLLDDVMSELDESRRQALARFVECAAQTFITTANLGYFSDELVGKAHVIEMPIEGTRHVYP